MLDAGCGTGRLTREIARHCRKVYGIDFSPKSIEVLNIKARSEGIDNIETHICDIKEILPFSDKVDKVVSVQVIQHIPNDIERYKALRNLYSKLKSNGICVISVYNWKPIFNRELIKEGVFQNGVYYYRFTPGELYALFKKCGFKHISVRGSINLAGYNLIKNKSIYKLLYPIAKMDTFISEFKLSRCLGAFLVCSGVK